tara:strand:- start:32166 stop:32495 length:330 start_codon:yes stop_codon:yes gene_type:complete
MSKELFNARMKKIRKLRSLKEIGKFYALVDLKATQSNQTPLLLKGENEITTDFTQINIFFSEEEANNYANKRFSVTEVYPSDLETQVQCIMDSNIDNLDHLDDLSHIAV